MTPKCESITNTGTHFYMVSKTLILFEKKSVSFPIEWIRKALVSPACSGYGFVLFLSACFLEKMEGFYRFLIQ